MLQQHTMTVRQLIESLEQYDDDMLVVLQGDYGDRINTPEVHFIQEPQEAFISRTAYSNTGWKVCFDSDERDEDSPEVLVLSYDERY